MNRTHDSYFDITVVPKSHVLESVSRPRTACTNCFSSALSTVFCSGLLSWSADKFCLLHKHIVHQRLKESACRTICILCQQTSPKRRCSDVNMTSNGFQTHKLSKLCEKSVSKLHMHAIWTKLHTLAASNNTDHMPWSLYYCLFVPRRLYGCYSSRTSRSWWSAHSTQRQPRGCNSYRKGSEKLVPNSTVTVKWYEKNLSRWPPLSFNNPIQCCGSLLTASRRGASPQNFEKRALTIFRLEPDRYESAHQLNCSLLLPIAMATESKALSKLFVGKSNKQQISAAIDRQHGFWKTTETN